MEPSIENRFWSKVDAAGDCWLWTAAITDKGYGTFSLNGKMRKAHHIAYELLVGPRPDGLVIDHLCRVRNCVNPDHLEWVAAETNTLRGFSPSAKCARKTYCKRGHEFTPENTYIRKSGARTCRQCRWASTASTH